MYLIPMRVSHLSLFIALLALVISPTCRAATSAPLKDDKGNLQRMLSLPDAKFHNQPNEASSLLAENTPVFSIFYLYGWSDDKTWAQVADSHILEGGGKLGWIQSKYLQPWRSMLVMQYAPKGQRERALFFKEKKLLKQFINSNKVGKFTKGMLKAISENKQKKGLFVAVESSKGVDTQGDDTLYLMPVLDWERGQFRASGEMTTMLEVASLNSTQSAPPPTDADAAMHETMTGDSNISTKALNDFKVGITFVIDTTTSMQRYIDETSTIISRIYQTLRHNNLTHHVRFGLVGFRDYMEHNPRIEYVSRVYQGLDPKSRFDDFELYLSGMRVTKISTKGWDEDVYAGVATALKDDRFQWNKFNTNYIILITDAGPRRPNWQDPLASTRHSADTLRRLANDNNIAIMPIHLLTPQAKRQRNLEWVRSQYRLLSRTGDLAQEKYLPVDLTRNQRFYDRIDEITRSLTDSLLQLKRGQPLKKPLITASTTDGVRAGDLFVNEMFRGQSDFLGEVDGVKAPRFYKAWLADKDLTNPGVNVVNVKLFLTKTQLNELSKSLKLLLEQIQENDITPGGFFKNLQSLSGSTATDPSQGMKAFIPRFIEDLPYHSKVLSLNKETWMDWGMGGRNNFIEELETKLDEYEDLNNNTDKWKYLGSGTGEKVSPVDMEYLP